MVIEGFRGSSGGGSIGGGGGGGGGGHESQLSFSGAGRPSATGFQHQVQPSSHFDRYDMDRNRNRDRDNDRYNTNNNVIHVGGGGRDRDGYDRNNWNGYFPPYTYYNPLVYQDRQPTEIVVNENKPKDKMDETVKILLIVFICMFALVMLFVMLNYFKK